MPETTPGHDIPYPSPSDPIRGSTGDYILTDLRDLALGTDSAITTAVGTRAPLSHTHTQAQIDGLSSALASAGETAQWGSVSGKPSAYPPGTHTHAVDDVTGLGGRLAALEYRSGARDIGGILRNGWAGSISLLRIGAAVSIYFENLSSAEATSTVFLSLPAGFRPPSRPGARVYRVMITAGGVPPVMRQADIDSGGNCRIFTPTGVAETFSGSLEFTTPDAIPTTLPGTPT